MSIWKYFIGRDKKNCATEEPICDVDSIERQIQRSILFGEMKLYIGGGITLRRDLYIPKNFTLCRAERKLKQITAGGTARRFGEARIILDEGACIDGFHLIGKKFVWAYPGSSLINCRGTDVVLAKDISINQSKLDDSWSIYVKKK